MAASVVAISGCGGSDDAGTEKSGPSASKEKKKDGPDDVVRAFFAAVKRGADEKELLPMLTSTARKVMAEANVPLSPSANDTVEFKVGKVRYIDPDAAEVACTRSDLVDGNRRSSQTAWMLHRESGDWRIAGFASVLNGQTDTAVDFEDPKQMAALSASKPVARRPRQPGGPIQK